MATESHDRAAARDRYHRLLRMTYHNVGGEQHVMTPATQLWVICGHANVAKSDALAAMQAAREHGDVIRWRDGAGRYRYGLTPSGDGQIPFDAPAYKPRDRGTFRAVIETEAESDSPDRDVIGWCNQWLQRIDAGDGNG